MNRNTRIISLICGAFLCASLSAIAQGRIATVDLRKVFDGYWKTKQADAALKERAADLDKEHKALMADWTQEKEDYQKLLESANDMAVSVEERDKRKLAAEEKLKDLRDGEQTIVQFERQAKTTLDEQRRRMRDNILVEVRATLTGLARKNAFTMVVDIAAETVNATPVVLYTNGENDITDEVLAQLNAAAPVEIPEETSSSEGEN